MANKIYGTNITSIRTPVQFILPNGGSKYFNTSTEALRWYDLNYGRKYVMTDYTPLNATNPTELEEVIVTAPAKLSVESSKSSDPIRDAIFEGKYLGKKFTPTAANILHYLDLYDSDKHITEEYGDKSWGKLLGGLTLAGTGVYAGATAPAWAPAVGKWIMTTGGPMFAKYVAGPLAAGMVWDKLLEAVTGTTTTEWISNYLQEKGWNPTLANVTGGLSNPGYWINFGGAGRYTAPFFEKIGLGISNKVGELFPTKSLIPKFLTKIDKTTRLSNESNVTPTISLKPKSNYIVDGLWDYPAIKKDLEAGKLEVIDWIESPAYRAAAEANVKEAEAMGLKYIPTYEYPAYLNFKKGIKINLVQRPEKGAYGWVGTNAGSPITINLARAQNISTTMAHEGLHASRHGWFDPSYSATDMKKQMAYLRYKNSLVFKDDLADCTKEADCMFYDFGSKGWPHEAVANSRDLGKAYGIKVGQEYPGPEKTLELLNEMELEAVTEFLKKFVKAFRRDPEHLEYVWKALNGTLWSLIPISLIMGGFMLNSQQNGL